MANVDKARDGLDKILSQKEYQIYYEDNRSFLEMAWDKVKTWVLDVLSQMFSSFEPSNSLGDVIVAIMVLIVLVMLGVAIWLVVRSVRQKNKFRSIAPLDASDELAWSWKKHLEKADAFSANASYAEAARHVFLALLLYFDEIDWVEARSWKTNWEYFAELKRIDKKGAEAFFRLALIFDQVFYGEQPMERSDYEEYRKEADQWLDHQDEHQAMES